MPRKGKGNISAEGPLEELLEDKEIWGNELPFTEPYTNPENGKDPTKMGYSYHTKKDQSHPHSLPTGSSGRDKDESCWENG
jgi:hypothetical protein